MSQPIRRCLNCGNFHGTPETMPEGKAENWYYRPLPFGRVGPFCSMRCVEVWTYDGNPTADDALFTLEEVNRLLFVADRVKGQGS